MEHMLSTTPHLRIISFELLLKMYVPFLLRGEQGYVIFSYFQSK